MITRLGLSGCCGAFCFRLQRPHTFRHFPAYRYHYLGRYALTANLSLLRRSCAPRIVNLGNTANGTECVRFGDLQGEQTSIFQWSWMGKFGVESEVCTIARDTVSDVRHGTMLCETSLDPSPGRRSVATQYGWSRDAATSGRIQTRSPKCSERFSPSKQPIETINDCQRDTIIRHGVRR
jgi:hypothetical protein